MAKYNISGVCDKLGYWATSFSPKETQQLCNKLGISFEGSQNDLNMAIMKALDIEPSLREKMSDEDRLAKNLEKFAQAKGIDSDKLNKALKALGIM